MLKRVLVIKLGGSALTDKSRIYSPRIGVIQKAARQISKLRSNFSILLVYGAGSYGHIPVRKFGLAKGFKTESQLRGLAETKSRLIEWQSILTKFLHRANVPCIPLLASDIVTTSDGRIRTLDLVSLRRWMKLGCVPVIGGDIVPDSKLGFVVLSGDQLAAYLAIKLHASKLIFATDVDGIFDANPKRGREAHFLPNLTPVQARRVARYGTSLSGPDVTGGMGGKIMDASNAASEGIPVYFVNLMKNERLRKIALGLTVKRSEIKLE